MRTLTKLVFLGMVVSLVHSAPGGNKKNHFVENEINSIKENLTVVWDILNNLRNQVETLQKERFEKNDVRHHHHHYHHYYHDNFTEETNETDIVNHDINFELQFSNDLNLTNSDVNGDTHHHYHHHIHHSHSKPDEHTVTNGVGFHNPVCCNCNSNNSNPHPETNNPHGKEDILAQAVCQVRANRALPEKERQNIRGQVNFKQKGTILEIEVNIRGFLTTSVHAIDAVLDQDAHMHGLHVHEFGDLSNGCESAGGHYNPLGESHGAPDSPKRHIGDLGNIECDEEGKVEVKLFDKVASLIGTYSIIGKTLVISEGRDDFGLKENEGSLTNGNSGRRLACCIIQTVMN